MAEQEHEQEKESKKEPKKPVPKTTVSPVTTAFITLFTEYVETIGQFKKTTGRISSGLTFTDFLLLKLVIKEP